MIKIIELGGSTWIMDLWTIGSSSAVPTEKRGLPANMINYDGERILFDCGEGAQRKMMTEKMGLMKISRIFISHWHADHFSGLIGLIQTMEMEGRDKPLYIYGPPRTEEFTERILDTGYFNRNYDIYVEELVEGDAVVGEGYEVRPFEVEHGVNAFGYVFEENPQKKVNKERMKDLGLEASPKVGELKEGKSIEIDGEKIEPEDLVEEVRGRKIVYSGDTAMCAKTVENSKQADILIHEATCKHEMIHERKGHTSAKQAAAIADKANVEKLILTHISRRYRGREEEILNEAKEVFKNSALAEDGEKIEIKPHRPE